MECMSQFPAILLDDLDVTWWSNQATLTVNVMAYRFTRERALNVAKNVGVDFLYAAYSPGNDVESKTRHTYRAILVVSFGRSVIIAE